MRITNKTIIALFALLVLFIAGCQVQPGNKQVPPDVVQYPETGEIDIQGTQELKKFSSVEEIKAFLDAANEISGSSSRYYGGREMFMAESMDMMAEPLAMADSAGGMEKSSGSASDYSETNIQVKGVDEADIVKNDGKYIYTLVQDKLVIVNAFPADDAEILSETEIDGTPRNMFINEDRLALFVQSYDDVYVIAEYDYMPSPRRTQMTEIIIYDISDRENPEVVETYKIEGNYLQSRMIGDYVYFVSQDNVYYHAKAIDLPMLRAETGAVIEPDIYYFDNYEDNYNFNTVASFNIQDTDDLNAKTFMMGYANTIYVSQDHMYITYQKNPPWHYYRYNSRERFFDVVVPLLPADIRNDIVSMKDESWSKISARLEVLYNRLDENEKESLIVEISEAVQEYEYQKEIERRKSVIHKIAIDDGDIEYVTRGEVPGYLLNQFSLDEHKGNLRVATTTQLWLRNRGRELSNNVYVLDEDLDIIGELEEIAPDERIHSTRFMGDRLYMVTFKNVDPFFVIDLSVPTNPEILGELKIPGYSDYLHPYDENYIIGVGKEAIDMGSYALFEGVKIALFDVTDVSNPVEVDKVEIGGRGSDSEVLRDHKAFLFDKEKDILVIPVKEVKGDRFRDNSGYYRQNVWHGAYAYSLTPEDGFQLKGKISHIEGDQDQRYSYYSPGIVRRSLYMDNVLYTVSSQFIMMNDIDNLEQINELALPYKVSKYHDYPWY